MNREIIYRGKRFDRDEWIYGFYVESTRSWNGGHPHKSWILDSPFTNGGWFALQGRLPVKDDTVGQYTGLKDIKGNRIFEGDIVTDAISKGKPFGVITWHQDGYFFIDADFGKRNQYNQSYTPLGEMLRVKISGRPIEIEVMGNIHDNKDLIEK